MLRVQILFGHAVGYAVGAGIGKEKPDALWRGMRPISRLTLRITGRQKQSEARAALFAVRVNAIVMFIFGLASVLTLTPQVNRQHQEKGKPLQSTVPHP